MIFCRPIAASLLLAGIGLAGCVSTSAEKSMHVGGTTKIDVSSLPLVEHRGSVSAPELIMLFQEVCLQNFSDQGATRAAFVRGGFAIKNSDLGVGDEYDVLFLRTSNASNSIVGSFGQYPILDYAEVDSCAVEAYVTEPDAVEVQRVVSAIAAGSRFRQEGGLDTYTFNWRSADGRQAEIRIELPSISVEFAQNGELVDERRKFKIEV